MPNTRSKSAIKSTRSSYNSERKPNKVINQPEWDSTVHNLDQFKLSSEELRKRKLSYLSKNNGLYNLILGSILQFYSKAKPKSEKKRVNSEKIKDELIKENKKNKKIVVVNNNNNFI